MRLEGCPDQLKQKVQEEDMLGKIMNELVSYDEKLDNKVLEFIDIDPDDGVTANYVRLGLVEGV